MTVTAEKIRDKERNQHLKSLIETAELAIYKGNEALEILYRRQKTPDQGVAFFKATRATADVVEEFTSEGIELAEALESSEISALMSRHANKVAAERAVFKDYRWLDDLLVATTVTIQNRVSAEQFKQLEAMRLQWERVGDG